MKIKIAENIRTLRKQHSFTQEQLSEALGVTVSAVYKWESGQSVPEVKMLMELADLFEVSVDTLLGYDRQNENIKNRIKRIDQCITERDYDEAVLEAEKALKKYPNQFDIVFVTAHVYKALFYENRDEKVMKRAIELFYSAIPLLYQNKDTNLCEATILSVIGTIYIDAGQEDKGIELLKENNISGSNHAFIGYTLAMTDRYEEAKDYIYQSYVDITRNTLDTMSGMLYMYGMQKNENYKEAGNWLLNYLDSLVMDGEKVTFVIRFQAVILAQMSVFAAMLGNYEEAEENIKDAYRLAIKFDAQPDYTDKTMKFVHDWDNLPPFLLAYQDVTTISEIESEVFENAKPGEALDFVKAKFEYLKYGEQRSNEER